jgi:surfactin synthase thioesterase subunit
MLDRSSWIIRPQAVASPAMRLLCFHHAGGTASFFREWPADLPSNVEVCAIQLPGRESRFGEPLIDSLPSLLMPMSQAIIPLLDRPYTLFGHSLGALVAFELARALRRAGARQPEHLFVAGRTAPHLRDGNRSLHNLADGALVEELVKRYSAIPEEVLGEPELMELLIPMIRADLTIIGTYDYQEEAPLSCPITVLGGSEDANTSRAQLAAWQDHTESCKVLMLNGDHFFVRSQRPALLRLITQELQLRSTLKETYKQACRLQ